MIKKTTARKRSKKLPLHWVEEMGFNLAPTVRPGRDLLLVMRTDAWYANRLRVSVDGKPAGTWNIARSESAWVEPRCTVPGALLRRARPEFRIDRIGTAGEENFAPFRYWFYQ